MMLSAGDDIRVALTTTRHILLSDMPDEDEFRGAEIPVCVVEMGLAMWGSGLEAMEFKLSEMVKDMARTVAIDPTARRVFVGMDPAVEETGLVVYEEKRSDNVAANDFFRRWTDTRTLIMDFHVIGQNGKTRFNLRGAWIRDRWQSLEIVPAGGFTVI